MLAALSCNSNTQSKPAEKSPEVGIDSVTVQDSILDISNCKIHVTTGIAYPGKFEEGDLSMLQDLYAKQVLGIQVTDSIPFQAALKHYPQLILDSYRTPTANEQISPDDMDETDIVQRYDIRQQISPCYNAHGILTFCKTSELWKDRKRTMVTHNYYSFDTKNMVPITAADIFRDDAFSDIKNLLKGQLMKQEGVDSPSGLIDLGYFNIDNLSVTDNFSFAAKGIRFVYEPYEIACYAIGETTIELTYESLRPYLKDNAAVYNIIGHDNE